MLKYKFKIEQFWKIVLHIFLLHGFFVIDANAELTIQEAITSAMEDNPEMKVGDESLEVVKADRYRAFGGFLPKLSLNVNQGSQKTQVGGSSKINGNVAKRSISASQDLFNGGHTIFDIKRSNSEVKKELANRESRKQEIFLSVIEVYLDLLRNEELMKISEENLFSQKRLLRNTRKKFKARYSTKSELAKVVADYQSAIGSKQVIASTLESKKAVFRRLTMLNYDEVKPLKEIEASLLQDNKALVKEEEMDLHMKAVRRNPQVRAAKYSYRSAKYERSMAKASLSPTLRFQLESSKDKDSLYFDNREQRNNSAFLNLTIPIFNSGIGFSSVKRASHKARQEKHTLEAVRNNVEQIVSEEISKIKNLESQYESALALESANKTLVRALKVEERLGTKSIMELLRAKRDLYAAKTDRVNFYYDKILTYFRLKTLLGEKLID